MKHAILDVLSGEAKSLVFGGLDGVCTSLALVWSGIGAGDSAVNSRSLLVIGVAGLISQGFSMGLGNYLGGSVDAASAAQALRSGCVMSASFIWFGAIPLITCLVPSGVLTTETHLLLLVVATLSSLFLLGMVTGILAKQSLAMSGFGMVMTGMCAAVVSFSVSASLQQVLHTPPLHP